MKDTTVFQNGNSQAIRIPKEMRLESDTVMVEKVGNVLVIVEANDPWASARLGQLLLAGEFMPEGRQVNPIQERKGLKKATRK